MKWLDVDRYAHVGWDWYGFEDDDKWTDAYAAPYLERGDVVIVEEVYDLSYVSVTRLHDGFKVEMTFAWLLPLAVLETPPLAPPLAPSSASADEALVPLSPPAPRWLDHHPVQVQEVQEEGTAQGSQSLICVDCSQPPGAATD